MDIQLIIIGYLAAALFMAVAVRNDAFDVARYALMLILAPVLAPFFVGCLVVDGVRFTWWAIAERFNKNKE